MTDLDEKEQKHVRTALRYLRRRCGAWTPVAEALHLAYDTVEKVVNGRRPVTARVAMRVARVAGVGVDELLDGRYLPGACPHCGHVPDFGDEPTMNDGVAVAPRSGLLGGRARRAPTSAHIAL